MHSYLEMKCSWPCGYDLHNVNWYRTMFWISSQTGTREPKKRWAFPSLLRSGLVLKPIIITCVATLLTIALLLVTPAFVSKPACGYSPVLFVTGLVKFELKGLNVVIHSYCSANNEKLFVTGVLGSVFWIFCGLSAGTLELLFLICIVGGPGHPRKGLYKSRIEGTSHLGGV